MNSLLSAFLSIAKVRYTESYLNKIAQTHPFFDGMFLDASVNYS